jgi:hypothetical protein
MLGIGLELTGCGLGGGGSGTPSLDLNFLTMTADTFDSRVTFSRASLAWQYDSTGTLVTVPHNLLPESETFGSATWSKTRSAVTSNIVADPVNGTTTADKLTEQTDVATTRSMQNTISVVVGNTYALSVYAKSAERTAINLRFGSGFAAGNVTYDLSGGTLSSGGSVASSSITSIGSGWYRCFCAFVCTSSTSAGAQIFLSSGGTITYDGVSGNGVYLWGAQSSQHNALRPYLNTSVKNLLGFSEDCSNAAFTKTSTTITTNAATAPNSTTTADKLIASAASATHHVYQNVTVTSGSTYTYSVYLKAAEYTTASVYLNDAANLSNRVATAVDLTTGVLSATSSNGTFTGAAATVASAGNDWWRVAITGVVGIATVQCRVFIGGNSAFLGDGTSGIYIWGSQLAASGSLDTYVPTVGAAPSSAAYHGPVLAYDPSTLAARGLRIEEARTNLTPGLLSSSTYWTPLTSVITQGATAPDGTATAFTITCNAGGVTSYGANLQAASIPTITAGAMTASIFVKSGSGGWFRLILADATTPTIGAQCYFNTATGALGTVGTQAGVPSAVSAVVQTISNGWYRVSLTATLGAATTATMLLRLVSANGVTTDLGSSVVLAFNPQLEVGGFATSPILTSTATVARSADLASINPLGSWFNPVEGTLFVEASRYGHKPSQQFAAFHDGTSNNNIGMINGTGTPAQQRGEVTTGGVAQVQLIYSNAATVDTVYRQALAYKLNDFAGSVNGGAALTDSSGTIPVVDRMSLGTNSANTVWLAGYIRKIKVWTTRRANGELPNITT